MLNMESTRKREGEYSIKALSRGWSGWNGVIKGEICKNKIEKFVKYKNHGGSTEEPDHKRACVLWLGLWFLF